MPVVSTCTHVSSVYMHVCACVLWYGTYAYVCTYGIHKCALCIGVHRCGTYTCGYKYAFYMIGVCVIERFVCVQVVYVLCVYVCKQRVMCIEVHKHICELCMLWMHIVHVCVSVLL